MNANAPPHFTFKALQLTQKHMPSRKQVQQQGSSAELIK